MQKKRLFIVVATALAASGLVVAVNAPKSASAPSHVQPGSAGSDISAVLPAPPPPPVTQPASPLIPKLTGKPAALFAVAPTSFNSASTTPSAVDATAVATNGNGAPGATTIRKTLVLYDSTGQWGWLGEAYATNTANLVSHGSPYVMHPVATYVAGEMAAYNDVVYIGSTYNEPIPLAFLDDTLTQSRSVLWMGDNIWQLDARATNFATQYGWKDGYYDFIATPTVTYKGVALSRDPLASQSGLLQTSITDPAKASVLATANKSDGTTEPWAVTGGGLTYVGEVPFSYVGATDRYFAAADMINQLANPNGQSRTRALVRLEDVSSTSDPTELLNIVNYLYGQGVPFSVNVISLYLDPNGYYNGGKSQSIPMNKAPSMVSVLKYALTHGGSLNMEGYTHQYSNVDNPYTGVSGDDFEFYLAHLNTATNGVIYDGPIPVDSAKWAQTRITNSQDIFTKAGLPQPTIYLPPHYAASAVDYTVFAKDFRTRYDRGLYFGGWCTNGACGTGTPDYTKIYGQYFPFLVRDIYGSAVVPEDLGEVDPVALSNHPARFPADILASATGLSVVKDAVASFYFQPYLDINYLKQVVSGLKGMGYTFVSAATVAAG